MTSIEEYIVQHSSSEEGLLAELARETALKKLYPQMLSGSLQGKFLQFISQMLKPEIILEIGTFTGYSALCLAAGLSERGELHTIEINDEHQTIIEKYFSRSVHKEKLHLHIGAAEIIIPDINRTFDLVFIDAEKQDYIKYYNLVLPKLNAGGFILADNVLWYEKVLQPDANADAATKGIKSFNQIVNEDPRTENIILPLRDGISLIRKKYD